MMHRQRRAITALVATASAVLSGAAVLNTSASAAPVAGAQSEVVSGDARFEVLSPTLIRTEYAGDSHFVDAPTFNAVGRDGFARTPFSATTVDGWLTIDTAAMTLRYKVGSGPFGADNLSVRLRAGDQKVTGWPWGNAWMPVCSVGALCEAEDLSLDGVSAGTDHTGYTGSGFAAGFQDVGDAASFQVQVPAAGTYQFAARYANWTGQGQTVTRTLTVSADGGSGRTLTMPVTGSWDDWAIASTTLDLSAGTHTISVTHEPTDDGNVNIDSIALTTPGAGYPPPAVERCVYGTVCEAESGDLGGGAVSARFHNDFSGAGFVTKLTTAASDTVHLTGVPAAGAFELQLRYTNAWDGPREISVQVNSDPPTAATLPTTSSWDAWRTLAVPVRLAAGDNEVTVGCPQTSSCKENLDTVAVSWPGSALLAPHAPLGGYRRGLDGVKGSTVTTPGLLYQDGWSLLDDTSSAIFDDASKKVTPRPDHGGMPYRDGYVFGYGHDYGQGLEDLATLTGPSELLPRWAYGVWYSEYYDHTAADYENTILPKFRSEGVPLDVLVTDTDYKSPLVWDGWEIDTSKFPDPKAFFDWAAANGLHNTLNIHPSITSLDPQFEQAEATAAGNLEATNCHGSPPAGVSCYVFDWGQPDQLKAYLALHQTMEQQGADFWWLDWCCEQSQSSLPGVTPDAWINQQYALDADKLISRGFVLSRAYGSLQAAGYGGQRGLATGPWADKRSTVHFTGDAYSNWPMLEFEVGYTPGESASTGLSAVSHDIGGFQNDGTQTPGAEPGSTKEADDLYARWVQLGTFQPIDRLHGSHSDRLPWQYGSDAKTSAEKFLNLRENLVPYTYTLAAQATRTGVPVVRPLYLQYPDQQDAYAQDGAEYLYGPDVLVAPVTTPGTTATTSVWFPPGSSWTDYFTGKTYAGGTTQDITTDLGSMPVFLKSGGILTTRTDNVTNDVQNPLTKVTVTVAAGAGGHSSLYEDDGSSTNPAQSATTDIAYAEQDGNHQLRVGPALGSFPGQVTQRAWTVEFRNADAPHSVLVDGVPAHTSQWTYAASTRTLTVSVPSRSVEQATVISYR